MRFEGFDIISTDGIIKMFIINRVPLVILTLLLLLMNGVVNSQAITNNFTVLLFSFIGNKSLVVNNKVN